jgi:hypothetical protein
MKAQRSDMDRVRCDTPARIACAASPLSERMAGADVRRTRSSLTPLHSDLKHLRLGDAGAKTRYSLYTPAMRGIREGEK